MNSRFALASSSPSWVAPRRAPAGGLALVAFWALLWTLFLGTVGAAPAPSPGPALASTPAALAR